MRKWKQRCSVILGLTVLGFANLVEVVTPFVETTKVYAQEKEDGYSNSLKFSGTTTTSKSQVTYHDPMDLIQIIDLSGSLSDFEFERANGVAGGRKQQINDMIYVIENKLTDEDHVMLAFYGTNTEDSYVTGDREGSDITRLLTKKEAIDLLKELNSNEEVHSISLSSSLISSYVSPLIESKKYSVSKNFPIGTGFEDVYKAQPNRNKQVSVLQFTDDWTVSSGANENIDTSFADWAKSNAKTFMTVVDSVVGNDALSVSQLKKAGHPNIKVFTKLDTPNRQEDIAKLFESTALVVVNKTVKQKGVRTKDEPSIKEEVLKEAVDKVVARGSKSAVATKELDYKTTYVEDKESEAGKKTVVTKGSKGHETSTVTHSFNSETGEVTANEPKVEKTESVDEVISVGTKPVVTTKDLDYKTKYVEDKESEAGKKTVVTKGSKGHETTTITYSFNSETGEVTANEPKVEKTESVDEVISVGTKPKVEIMETEFKTEKRENKDLKKGEEKIIQAGVKGRETITTTYYLDPDTGEVKENKPSLEKVDPVNEIIEVGTQAEKVLPNTGTSLSNFLTLTGMIGIALGISVIIYRKLNKKQ
ncbi:Zinc metalloprotease zmpC [Streptococcus pneumoniae]|uniref:G5 domain-containing protein n=1 Tax=Streptococcus pneumoniae TaxID=1313 RepID=UPI0005E69E00|nr:G5 domain-containing protein [Streptococcus pneumoniae]CJR01333.1 Zinc metalloprotease zmpC [Streptococcus pneumoniae]CJS23506.1 Zinc metalloprotease zmpC [Streptococcus pneumoniae]CJU64992.1 Zinc metalloprotease zmpC [Streptococcus pneumoniae]CJU74946.1 Zinc metalloprotease zmpC [Streptococcus pneumoniae]CKG66873.1 Zinc metalloprotease zmpC [Streptococcus pneumoniae]